jgi:hypothetical protein
MKNHNIKPRVAAKRNQFGKNNSSWKGDNASYTGFHARVERTRGKPKKCEVCNIDDPNRTYDWANLTGNYPDINDYKRMCRQCHWVYDGRSNKKEVMPNV